MTNPQVEQFIRNIREKLPIYETPEKCAEVLKQEYLNILSPLSDQQSRQLKDNLDKACEIVKSRLENVEILRRCSIIKERENWYTGPSATDRHWPAMEAYLKEMKGWNKSTVDSIDSTSSEIVSLLANPAQESFRCRGLVVGHVQSGKTANMTAVIAKAVDAGYNLIVVLAGLTNKLRAQTQRRLEKDVVSRHRSSWQLYTTSDENGDFVVPLNGSFTKPHTGGAQLAVIKKVTSRLEAFLHVIKETDQPIRRTLKVLIIDDECDQASVNSANDDYNTTKINSAIRRIIKNLPAISYVGYTATPFANVFINPFPHNKENLDDLYPEDFITSLPKNNTYFGAEEVFGRDPFDAEDETEDELGLDMIRLIPDDELPKLVVKKAADKEIFHPELTESLRHALHWFIGSCAIRLDRGHENENMTMLIHTSPFVAQHKNMSNRIRSYIEETNIDELTRQITECVLEEYDRVPAISSEHDSPPSPESLANGILSIIRRLEIVIENGESERRLDYTNEPKIYIVVGGAVLARGLTLEGLSVSFFLRTSSQYDTLLQMGRWFGYRHGYEDLPRLWTTEELASKFRALARIETEIRQDIEIYRQNNVTPLEFAVRVRSIPGMAITSASKMRHAYRTSISYEGKHVQTIRFEHLNDEVVIGNWKAATNLVDQIGANSFTHKPQGLLAKKIPAENIRQFLKNYSISDNHMDLRKDYLLEFFDKSSDRWPEWNVAIILPKSGEASVRNLGQLNKVSTVNRSRLKELAGGHADIKALMSKRDILIDSGSASAPSDSKWDELKALRPSSTPLLLVYPISAQSVPQRKGDTRVPLEAVSDLVGIGIVFPGTTDRSGRYFAVELDVPTPEQLDEEDYIEDDEVELINDSSL